MLKLFERGIKQGYATNSSSYHNTVMWSSLDEDKIAKGINVLIYDPDYPAEYIVISKETFDRDYTLDPNQKEEGIYLDEDQYEYKTGTFNDLTSAIYERDEYGDISEDSLTLPDGTKVYCFASFGRDG